MEAEQLMEKVILPRLAIPYDSESVLQAQVLRLMQRIAAESDETILAIHRMLGLRPPSRSTGINHYLLKIAEELTRRKREQRGG